MKQETQDRIDYLEGFLKRAENASDHQQNEYDLLKSSINPDGILAYLNSGNDSSIPRSVRIDELMNFKIGIKSEGLN